MYKILAIKNGKNFGKNFNVSRRIPTLHKSHHRKSMRKTIAGLAAALYSPNYDKIIITKSFFLIAELLCVLLNLFRPKNCFKCKCRQIIQVLLYLVFVQKFVLSFFFEEIAS